MGILLQILSILIALVAITVSWQIVRNTHRIAFHGESAWRKALFEAIDNPRWTAADLEKIRLLCLLNEINRETLPYSETRILRQLVRMKLKNDWLVFNGQNKEFNNDEIIEKWLP